MDLGSLLDSILEAKYLFFASLGELYMMHIEYFII